MTRLYGAEVGDARVAPAVEFGVEPGGEDLLGEIVGERSVGKTQHVGVIPHSGARCLPGIGAQRSANAGYLVGRNADTRSGPAEEHALIAIAACHRLSGRLCGQCPRRLRAGYQRPEGHDLMTVSL